MQRRNYLLGLPTEFRNVRRPAGTPRAQSFMPTQGNYEPMGRGPNTDFMKAYLNGMHQDNYSASPGVPAGPGMDRVVRHTKFTTTLTSDTSGKICLLATGIPEAPLIRWNNNGPQCNVYPWPNMPWTNNTTETPFMMGADYFKQQGVEAYRVADLAIKIEDETPPMYQTGDIKGCILPTGIDIVPCTNIQSNADPNVVFLQGVNCPNIRVIDGMCTTPEQMDRLSNNCYSGMAKHGYYRPIPVADWTFPYRYRDGPDNKAVYTRTFMSNINNGAYVNYMGNVLGIQDQSANQIWMPKKSGPQTTSTVSGSTTDVGLLPVHPSTTQTCAIIITGLDVAQARFKVTMTSTWEMIIGTGSTLQDMITPQRPVDLDTLQFVANVMRVMPGGYPASANSWDDIWTKAKEIWSGYVSPFASKVISALPPEYAAIGAGAKSALDMVAGTKKAADKAVAAATQATHAANSATAAATTAAASASASTRGRK